RGATVRFSILLTSVGLLSCLAIWARGDDPDPAIAIVDSAVKAHGGIENLVKTYLMTRKATGTMSFFGQEVPFTDELTLQLPNRSRWVFEGGPEGQKTKFTVVCRDDKGWQSTGGTAMEVNK